LAAQLIATTEMSLLFIIFTMRSFCCGEDDSKRLAAFFHQQSVENQAGSALIGVQKWLSQSQ
jgi:hypothetical protein